MTDDRVSVVWCDFGGVLTPPIQEAIDAMVAVTGVPWGAMRKAIDEVARTRGLTGLQPLELGVMTEVSWGAEVSRRLAEPCAVDLGRWGDYWYAARPLNTQVVEELRRISRRGVLVGLLTNSVREWEPHRREMLAEVTVFAGVVRSHEVGLAKPDPRIFEYADDQLPPGRGAVVLIDDSAENCSAATEHGWIAVHHRDNSCTTSRLRSLVP